MGAAASDRSALFFFPSMTGFAMPRVFAALLLPHDVCDALARRRQGFRQNRSSGPLHPKHQPSPDACLCGRDFDDRRPQTLRRPPSALCAYAARHHDRTHRYVRSTAHSLRGSLPAESLDPVVNEVRSTITRLGLPLDDKPFRAHITLARDWRRGHPPMTLPARTVPLSGPVLMETVKDPRTGMIRYRQVL